MPRSVVPALDDILDIPQPVLDQGFVTVIDYMGDDAAVPAAARLSYQKGTRKVSTDKGLIDYLMRHRHTSPFEMCEIKLHIRLPIFVARQWIRHRMANVNEMSGRYSELPREFYIPEPEHIAEQSASNKQGRGQPLSAGDQERFRARMTDAGHAAFDLYDEMLEANVARELSRVVLPLSTYTEMFWKIDLHNLLHFLALRMDSHAQYEIRAYADVIGDIVSRWVPDVWDAFTRYRRNAVVLSAPAMDAVRAVLAKGAEDAPAALEAELEARGLSKREIREVMEKLV